MKKLTLALVLILAASLGWAQTQTAATNQNALAAYKNAEKAYANAAFELQRVELRKEKRDIIDAVAKFTDSQAKAFWPIYDNYEKELVKLNDQRMAVIKDYADNWTKLTDAKALELAARSADFAEKRLALRKTYMENMKKVLPGILVARLMQLEHQLDLLIDLEIASEVPLAE